jgi:hypothetical protein
MRRGILLSQYDDPMYALNRTVDRITRRYNHTVESGLTLSVRWLVKHPSF